MAACVRCSTKGLSYAVVDSVLLSSGTSRIANVLMPEKFAVPKS